MTVAHRNYERMLIHVLKQQDEAWNEENALRARQVELDEMGSGVIMAEDDDDIEINGHEDVPPGEEEDEELEPASDEDGGEIFDTDFEDDA